MKKTLIFFGSPRRHGDTWTLLEKLLSELQGEYLLVDAYRDRIHPCTDCRACREKNGCVFQDDMQKVYDYIPACDNVIIAAPLYFSELPGQLLNVFSRLQCMYSARRFRHEKTAIHEKKGGVILVGGGDGGPEKALSTCEGIFKYYMNAKQVHPPVMSLKTDALPACKDEKAMIAIRELARYFNE